MLGLLPPPRPALRRLRPHPSSRAAGHHHQPRPLPHLLSGAHRNLRALRHRRPLPPHHTRRIADLLPLPTPPPPRRPARHPDPHLASALAPIRDAVLAVDNPRTALGWLARSRGADLLGRIAHAQLPLTHAALDDQPPGMSIEHLRRMLVAAGALPERNEHLARLEHFAAALLETVDNVEDRRILRSFTTWHVLHRLRANEASRPITAAAAYRCRAELTATARFLGDPPRPRPRPRHLPTARHRPRHREPGHAQPAVLVPTLSPPPAPTPP